MRFLFRPSEPEDLAAITAIYGHHVLTGTGTFETTPPSEAEMAARRADVLSKKLPYLVATDETGTNVLGFAYCNWFKPRPAYQYCAEDSIYLAEAARGRGIGGELLKALCDAAEKAGVRKLVAVIGDSSNHASIGIHRKQGFSEVGILRNAGWKFERWLDVVLMDKTLGAGAGSAPS